MVCCIAAAFVFGLFARFFRKIFRRPDPALSTAPPPTPRIEVSPRAAVATTSTGNETSSAERDLVGAR